MSGNTPYHEIRGSVGFLDGMNRLEEVQSSVEALQNLVAEHDHLGALTGQAMASLLAMLGRDLAAAQRLLRGRGPAEAATSAVNGTAPKPA